MDYSAEHPDIPPAISRSCEALQGLGRLLLCVDAALWNTLARPTPVQLGALILRVHADLAEGLEAADFNPS